MYDDLVRRATPRRDIGSNAIIRERSRRTTRTSSDAIRVGTCAHGFAAPIIEIVRFIPYADDGGRAIKVDATLRESRACTHP